MTIRYFRRTDVRHSLSVGPNEFPTGHIKTFPNSLLFNGNEYWEEVIVTPKPQPKKFKKRLCLAIHKHWLSLERFDMVIMAEDKEILGGWKDHGIVQLTDWVEVEFTERTKEEYVFCSM